MEMLDKNMDARAVAMVTTLEDQVARVTTTRVGKFSVVMNNARVAKVAQWTMATTQHLRQDPMLLGEQEARSAGRMVAAETSQASGESGARVPDVQGGHRHRHS